MEEDKKTPVDQNIDKDLDKKGNNDGEGSDVNGSEPKTFTQEDVDKVISERLAREAKKFDKKMEETLKKEREEAQRLAELSADEKEKELKEKEKKEFESKRHELQLKENRLEGRIKLQDLGLSESLIELVISEDLDSMLENIDTLNDVVNEMAEAKYKAKLKGDTPKDPSSDSSDDDGGEETFSQLF